MEMLEELCIKQCAEGLEPHTLYCFHCQKKKETNDPYPPRLLEESLGQAPKLIVGPIINKQAHLVLGSLVFVVWISHGIRMFAIITIGYRTTLSRLFWIIYPTILFSNT